MGQLFSRYPFSDNTLSDIFITWYLSRRGITPYNLELLPEGQLQSTDDPAVKRHKLIVALHRQKQLEQALRQIERDGSSLSPIRCFSPVLLKDFGNGEQKRNVEVDSNANVVKEFNWAIDQKKRVPTSGFGSLDRLISPDSQARCLSASNMESEEILCEYDVVKTTPDNTQKQREPLRGSVREKRSRSRPELGRLRKQEKRQTMSVTEVPKEPDVHLLPPLKETPSHELVERIELRSGKRSKTVWPSKDSVRRALKDPKVRITCLFMARFRTNPEMDYVELDYRFNKFTGQDSFQVTKGAFEDLLIGDQWALNNYISDKDNNNVDVKEAFFHFAPYFFNNLEGRIWWNGFIASIEGDKEKRMVLKSLKMDPPALVFDAKGFSQVSAKRNHNKFTFMGSSTSETKEQGDKAIPGGENVNAKEFVIRGRTDKEVKQLAVDHDNGTTLVSILIPTLSGIPVSTSSGSKIGKGTSAKPAVTVEAAAASSQQMTETGNKTVMKK